MNNDGGNKDGGGSNNPPPNPPKNPPAAAFPIYAIVLIALVAVILVVVVIILVVYFRRRKRKPVKKSKNRDVEAKDNIKAPSAPDKKTTNLSSEGDRDAEERRDGKTSKSVYTQKPPPPPSPRQPLSKRLPQPDTKDTFDSGAYVDMTQNNPTTPIGKRKTATPENLPNYDNKPSRQKTEKRDTVQFKQLPTYDNEAATVDDGPSEYYEGLQSEYLELTSDNVYQELEDEDPSVGDYVNDADDKYYELTPTGYEDPTPPSQLLYRS